MTRPLPAGEIARRVAVGRSIVRGRSPPNRRVPRWPRPFPGRSRTVRPVRPCRPLLSLPTPCRFHPHTSASASGPTISWAEATRCRCYDRPGGAGRGVACLRRILPELRDDVGVQRGRRSVWWLPRTASRIRTRTCNAFSSVDPENRKASAASASRKRRRVDMRSRATGDAR